MLACHRLLTGELEYWVVVVVVEGGGGLREQEALGPSRRGGGEQAGRQSGAESLHVCAREAVRNRGEQREQR